MSRSKLIGSTLVFFMYGTALTWAQQSTQNTAPGQTQAPNAAAPAPTTGIPPMPADAMQKLQIFVYPKAQQSAELQQKDESECYFWAQQQTGINPENPQVATAQTSTAHGGAAGGAAKGAAGGAAIGAVTGDAGTGAAAGAVGGAVVGRHKKKAAQQQQQKEAAAQQQSAVQQQMTTFKNAMSSCLEGRNYSVK